MKTLVFDFGGSIIVPNEIDTDFLKKFRTFLSQRLEQDKDLRAIIVVGGGSPARVYQNAYKALQDHADHDTLDRIGIAATKLNASLLVALFAEYCEQPVVEDPSNPGEFTGRILVGAGWKPGFSSDFDAVLLAEKFQAQSLMNLSNITQIYSDDPNKNPQAKPYSSMTWAQYEKLCGTEWVPGANLPFDPVATAHAKKIGLHVTTMNGRNLDNLANFLDGKEFIGTEIH